MTTRTAPHTSKGYIGIGMEGFIANWYAKNTEKDYEEFRRDAQRVAEHVAAGGSILELAPGPGYLAIELARLGRYTVTGLDISRSFVQMAQQKAAEAGVTVDFRLGNASQMPFENEQFDFVVCRAAFKNFSEPLAALNEIYRVLKIGGEALILDLRSDASEAEINERVEDMGLSSVDALLTRLTFKHSLLKRAYAPIGIERLAGHSRFGEARIEPDGIGMAVWLTKQAPRPAEPIVQEFKQGKPMTQRSIPAGPKPTVIIRAGRDVTVQGWDNEVVQADAPGRAGLKLERRSEAEGARMRAAVGDHVLFVVGVNVPGRKKEEIDPDAIQTSFGGDGRVKVPRGSRVKVYGGRNIEVQDVAGPVSVYAGRDAQVRGVGVLAHASAGRSLDLDCESLAGDDLKFSAGRDLRCRVRNLADVRILVSDMGGPWETVFGTSAAKLRLNSGGDVTLVTDQEVTGQPPDYVVGGVERPEPDEAASGEPEESAPGETSA